MFHASIALLCSLAPVGFPLVEQHGELAPFEACTDPFPAPHNGATFIPDKSRVQHQSDMQFCGVVVDARSLRAHEPRYEGLCWQAPFPQRLHKDAKVGKDFTALVLALVLSA